MGRRRIEIKKIDCPRARVVTFSKRHQGLFKKAAELSRLCSVDVAAVVFSRAGKILNLATFHRSWIVILPAVPHRLSVTSSGVGHNCLSEIESKLGMNVSSLSLPEFEEYSCDLEKMKGDLLRSFEEKQTQLNQYRVYETTSLVQDPVGSCDTQNEGLGSTPEEMMSTNNDEDVWRMAAEGESSDMVMTEGELDSMLAEWMMGDDDCNLGFGGIDDFSMSNIMLGI